MTQAPRGTIATVLMWVRAKFWRSERDFSPPAKVGDTEGVMKS